MELKITKEWLLARGANTDTNPTAGSRDAAMLRQEIERMHDTRTPAMPARTSAQG